MSWLWGRNDGKWTLLVGTLDGSPSQGHGQTPKQSGYAYFKLACIFQRLGVMPGVTDFQTCLLHPNRGSSLHLAALRVRA